MAELLEAMSRELSFRSVKDVLPFVQTMTTAAQLRQHQLICRQVTTTSTPWIGLCPPCTAHCQPWMS